MANCAQEPERIPGSVLPLGICQYNSVSIEPNAIPGIPPYSYGKNPDGRRDKSYAESLYGIFNFFWFVLGYLIVSIARWAVRTYLDYTYLAR